MKRHAPLPYEKRLKGIDEVVLRLVEKNIPKPAAQQDANDPQKKQVIKVAVTHSRKALAGEGPATQPEEASKGKQVHEPVPMYGHRTNGNGNRIETGVDEWRRHDPSVPEPDAQAGRISDYHRRCCP